MNRHQAGPGRRLGVALLTLAACLTVLGIPMASAQGTTLFIPNAKTTVPVDDPWSAEWDRIAPLTVALSGQAGVVPTLTTPTITDLRVRAVRDDERLSIMVEWADPTRDESTLGSNTFADQVALQFAQGDGISICMGQQSGAINVWLWKADWAADLDGVRRVSDVNPNMPTDETPPLGGSDGGPVGFATARDAGNIRSQATRQSSVEDLNAAGFGSLTAQPADRQNVHGASSYRDGTWRVVFTRDLRTGDLSDAVLDPKTTTVGALAVWDGANGDRDGRKAVSTWLALAFEPRTFGVLDGWPFLIVVLVAILASGGVLWLGFGPRSKASPQPKES